VFSSQSATGAVGFFCYFEVTKFVVVVYDVIRRISQMSIYFL